MKTLLTDNELVVMKAIDGSEYGEYITDEIWTQYLGRDTDKLQGLALSATCSSLKKKGYISTGASGGAACIGMTRKGAVAYMSSVKDWNKPLYKVTLAELKQINKKIDVKASVKKATAKKATVKKAPAKRQDLSSVHKYIYDMLLSRKCSDIFIMQCVKRTFKNVKLNMNLSQYRWHLNAGQAIAGLKLTGRKLKRIETM